MVMRLPRAAAWLAATLLVVGCATPGTVTTFDADGRPHTTVLVPAGATAPPPQFGDTTYIERSGRAVGAHSRGDSQAFSGEVPGFQHTAQGYRQQQTGLTLPFVQSGCTLVDLRESTLPGLPVTGAAAEYACPQPDLTYVALFLLDGSLPTTSQAACNLAVSLSKRDARAAGGLPCFGPAPVSNEPTQAPSRRLLIVQAGGRWSNALIAPRSNGSATVLHVGGNGAVAFTNTCIDGQCANRPAFGAFVDAFDLAALTPIGP